LHARDETGYQFKQARGLVILDSPIGLVAVLPIGMAQVSSCNINVEVGAELAKGEEFGFFLFGGSDIIVMFDQNCKVKICMKEDVHYNQGKTIAVAGDTPCPPPPPDPECWSPDKRRIE
jgi:phosphatidylserine decarboxylase